MIVHVFGGENRSVCGFNHQEINYYLKGNCVLMG
jgi:hypothetical protein